MKGKAPRGKNPVRAGKPAQSPRPERDHRPQRGAKPDRAAKPLRGGRSKRGQEIDRGPRPDRNSKSTRVQKPEFAKKRAVEGQPEKDQSPIRLQRPARERSTSDSGIFIVEGAASVAEYLKFKPASVKKVFATKTAAKTHAAQLSAMPVEPQIVEDREENSIESTRRSPVGAEVYVAAIGEQDLLKRAKGRDKDLILALDHIQDPRNLGAIVRSAAFFGIKEVVVSERRQALLSNTAVNTAQGGFALTDLCVAVNVGRTLDILKENGYWIVGADMEGESIKALSGFYDKVVLVMGSEESGLSTGIRGKCDRIISIAGSLGGRESLNVSVAAGILLHGLSPELNARSQQ